MTKRYLVTGASSGVGKAVAEHLASQGHIVEGLSRRQGGDKRIHWRTVDLFVNPFIVAHDMMQGDVYDGVFHAAGTVSLTPLPMNSPTTVDRAMMPVYAALGILRAAAQGCVSAQGSIVFMSSVAARLGSPALSAYGAGKAAIESVVRTAAIELAPKLIRVNAVAAGAFTSPMHQQITSKLTSSQIDSYGEKHPLGFGTSNDVRDAVLFLLGEGSEWVTGTTMVVDGGYSA